MKRIILSLVAVLLCLTACAAPKGDQHHPSAQAPQTPPAQQVQVPPAAPEPSPDLSWVSSRDMTRDQIRDGLVQLMNGPGLDPAAKLAAVFKRLGVRNFGPPALPYAVADLDGDGSQEYVMALPVTGSFVSGHPQGTRGALFVIYRQNGRWAVDRSEPMSQAAEVNLMAPALHAVVDLTGLGHPQIIWSRPHEIATGPQPTSFFVTTWKPGAFTHLPGAMAISTTPKDHPALAIEGNDLVLTGGSRGEMFLPPRSDRYRYVDGAFRLVDRRFINPGDSGYARLWDGLVAEEVGRTRDAEQSYRDAADPSRQPHAWSVPRYHRLPVELSPAELESFGQALRTLARFRLGALLKEARRATEATAALESSGGPYAGLLAAMQKAPTRQAGCQAAAIWAKEHPEFLAAFNQGVSDQPWTPDLLCGHVSLKDSRTGEDP